MIPCESVAGIICQYNVLKMYSIAGRKSLREKGRLTVTNLDAYQRSGQAPNWCEN